MAIAATVPWGDRELVAACVHLESHGDPAGRADQMESLLAELDVYAESRPVVLGGDFNTLSAAAIDTYRSAFRERMVRDDPERFVDPVRYEPLFEVASARGYDWRAANAPGPTQRTKTSGYPKPPLMRIDWLFVRGVAASEPVTVPAVGRYGHAISDHDLIAVTAT
jgi:endonuclease/exonuclease/phosphatase family metal-dependent hydrolase